MPEPHRPGRFPDMTRSVQRLLVALLLVVSVAACAPVQSEWASDEAIAAARHVHGGQPELTLVTILHRDSNRGDHTGLFINGQERVLFDPAGSWRRSDFPQRGDVIYGMTRNAGLSYYMSHVRETHYAVVQRVPVSGDVAAQALALALGNGAVAAGRCASSTSALLRQLPGFEDVRSTYFPQVLMRSFAEVPGVQTFELHHNDPEVQTKAWNVQEPLPALGL